MHISQKKKDLRALNAAKKYATEKLAGDNKQQTLRRIIAVEEQILQGKYVG